MRKYIKLYVLTIFTNVFFLSFAQNKTLDSLIRENVSTFTFNQNTFSGEGWEKILEQVKSNQHVLIGESHFTNEIPAFTKSIFDAAEFKNYYLEVDPYTTEIIENSINQLSPEELSSFNADYKDLFSFYAKNVEYDLLKHIINSEANLLGSDQIVMFSDRIIFDDLKKTTKNTEAKSIYEYVSEKSKGHLEAFLKDPQNNPMYMMTPDFSEQLKKLSLLNLSDKEHQIVKDLQLSKDIYETQSHKKRVRLIMNGVMNSLGQWKSNKTLFRYGANHLTRGESFLHVYDIGNLVANITESNYEDTFHIMILGESGKQGSPFRGFPSRNVDPEKGFYLSYLKSFFEVTEGSDWYLFDLRPLRQAIFKKELKIENLNLERAIRGYDFLVLIPEVTAAEH